MPRESKVPKALQPMLATLIDAPFDSRDWVFETKWDGFRLVARIERVGSRSTRAAASS
jgi:bifunctional non-homologous end joining protein LigD